MLVWYTQVLPHTPTPFLMPASALWQPPHTDLVKKTCTRRKRLVFSSLVWLTTQPHKQQCCCKMGSTGKITSKWGEEWETTAQLDHTLTSSPWPSASHGAPCCHSLFAFWHLTQPNTPTTIFTFEQTRLENWIPGARHSLCTMSDSMAVLLSAHQKGSYVHSSFLRLSAAAFTTYFLPFTYDLPNCSVQPSESDPTAWFQKGL